MSRAMSSQSRRNGTALSSAKTVLLSMREYFRLLPHVVGFDDLYRIIGEEKALCVKVGAEANDPSTEDVILVRGVSAEVDRAVKDILKIVEDAKNDLILSGYVCPSLPLPCVELTCTVSSRLSSRLTVNTWDASLARRVQVSISSAIYSASESTSQMMATMPRTRAGRKRERVKNRRLRYARICRSIGID